MPDGPTQPQLGIPITYYKQPYLDSSVFIAEIKQETQICPGGLMRWEIAHRILEDARGGRYVIYTSTVTLAEVRRIRGQNIQLEASELEEVRSKFAEFLEHEYMYLIEVNREIGEKAQDLGAQYDFTPIDAIHLASAIWWRCDVLLVWDKELTKKFAEGPIEGVRVVEPYREGLAKP